MVAVPCICCFTYICIHCCSPAGRCLLIHCCSPAGRCWLSHPCVRLRSVMHPHTRPLDFLGLVLPIVRGRPIIRFQDSTGVLSALVHGCASRPETHVVHVFHLAQFGLRTRVWLDWVQSDANSTVLRAAVAPRALRAVAWGHICAHRAALSVSMAAASGGSCLRPQELLELLPGAIFVPTVLPSLSQWQQPVVALACGFKSS